MSIPGAYAAFDPQSCIILVRINDYWLHSWICAKAEKSYQILSRCEHAQVLSEFHFIRFMFCFARSRTLSKVNPIFDPTLYVKILVLNNGELKL